MSILSRQQILDASDRERVTVKVPEWGGEVVITPLSVEQAKTLSEGNRDGYAITLMAVILGMVEPQLDPGDLVALGQKHAGVIGRLGKKIIELSGMGDANAEVERALGN